MKKLAIFDLDGTLFDTRKVNCYSYNKALEQFGISIDYNTFVKKCNGKHYKSFLPLFMQSDEDIETVHNLKKVYYSDFLYNAVENKALFSLIDSIKQNYYVALVTTASRKNCNEILGYFKKDGVFDLIISGEDVLHKKPNPEGFLKAMEFFNISNENTIVFEDSDVGIEAAQNCGTQVLVVKGYA